MQKIRRNLCVEDGDEMPRLGFSQLGHAIYDLQHDRWPCRSCSSLGFIAVFILVCLLVGNNDSLYTCATVL